MSRQGYKAAGALSRFEIIALILLSVTGHGAVAMQLTRARPPSTAPVVQRVEIQMEPPPVQPPIVPPQVEKPPPPPPRHIAARPVAQPQQTPPPPSEAPPPVAAEDVGPLPEGEEALPAAKPVESSGPIAPAAPPAPVVAAHEGANYLANPRPAYPELALQEGWQGQVLLRVRVSPEGRATTISVQRSSGQRVLDEAAIQAVRGWSFVPARQGSVPLAGWVTVPIVFRLQPGE